MMSIGGCGVEFQEFREDHVFPDSNSLLSNAFTDTSNFQRDNSQTTPSFPYCGVSHLHVSDKETLFSHHNRHHTLLRLNSPPRTHDKSAYSETETDSTLVCAKDVDSLHTNNHGSRNSYSLSVCSLSQGSPAVNHQNPELVSNVLIDEDSPQCSVDSNNCLNKKRHGLLTRQMALFDQEQSNITHPTPPTQNHLLEMASLCPPGPAPVVLDEHMSGVSFDSATTGKAAGNGTGIVAEKVDKNFDQILDAGISEMKANNSQRAIPTRRHSTNVDVLVQRPPTLSLRSTLLKRRTSLPYLAPLVFSSQLHDTRKLSDPAICLRKELLKKMHNPKSKRCLSDSEAPILSLDEDDCKSDECESSAIDSGYHDSRFQDTLSTQYAPSSWYSEDQVELSVLPSPSKVRRPTPYSPFFLKTPATDSMLEDHTPLIAAPPVNPIAKRSLTRHSSVGSIATSSVGGMSSDNTSIISSFWESQVSQVSVMDILSSLGFDDFDDPQLVPDRFIPSDMEHIRPSLMKMSFSEDDEDAVYHYPLRSISNASDISTQSTRPPSTTASHPDLPLGATAENFLDPDSPDPEAPLPAASSSCISTLTTRNLYRYNTVLETVPEETASDLSPSPRWLSPRVSIDHSVIDVFDGKLGASLNLQKQRKRSLPLREGFKLSIGSQVDSETGDSIHVSVTSYDDDIAAEKEREKEEAGVYIPVDDCTMQRRSRRKGVYVPPPSLMNWLTSQETIDEEHSNLEELPWPFSEEAKLRLSLTEMSLAQDWTDKLDIPDGESKISTVGKPTNSHSTNQNAAIDSTSDPMFDNSADGSSKLCEPFINHCSPTQTSCSPNQRSRSLSPDCLMGGHTSQTSNRCIHKSSPTAAGATYGFTQAPEGSLLHTDSTTHGIKQAQELSESRDLETRLATSYSNLVRQAHVVPDLHRLQSVP